MINFTSTNETIEGYAVYLKGYKLDSGKEIEERLFDVYSKLGHYKNALKSNKGLRSWKDGKRVTVPHRVEKVRITIEKIEDVEIGE
jgi:hypothetical protein